MQKKSGCISDISEVNIEVNWYQGDDEIESFSSEAFLVFEYGAKELIVRHTFGNDYRTTTKIVFAITDYLKIPYSETQNRR